jgi:GNAT superfamily N-acetyltransferase
VTLQQTVAFSSERRAEFLDLMGVVWGETLSPDEFDWWFERNPTGPRLISLVESDRRVACASAMSFLPMRLEGCETPVAFAVHAATHPEFRGQGIWPMLELHNEKEAARTAPVVLGFTNPVAGPILVGKLGWSDLAGLRIWAAPLRPAGRARGVEELDRFGPETDAVYERLSAAWPSHVVRRAEHLNWRFVDSEREYRRFACVRDGSVVGWAVVGKATYAGRRVAVLADLVAPSVRVARPLLAACKRAIGGVQALVALVSSTERAAFASALFVPTHKTIRFIGKRLRDDAPLPEGRAAWRFTLGDLDIF